MALTEQEFKAYIKRQLGAPVLQLELDEAHYTDIIQDTYRWFSDRQGLRKRTMFVLTAGQNEYILDQSKPGGVVGFTPGAEYVLDVIVEDKDNILRDDFGFFYGIPYFGGLLMGGSGPRVRGQLFSYSSMVQWLQYTEVAKRVLSGEFDSIFFRPTRTLFVFPVPNESRRLSVLYKVVIDGAFLASDSLSVREEELIRQWGVGKAKWLLSRIRSKYDSWPAAGRTVTLDGDKLMEEGVREMTEADTRLLETQYPIPFEAY